MSGTRRGANALDTLQDFEVAKASGQSGLGTLEGLYKLTPDNRDDLYLLAKGWAGATTAFTEDDYELAEEARDDALAAYHHARMIAGFQRARFFATKLLDSKAPGFEAAQRNTAVLKAWLRQNFVEKEDAQDLTVAAMAFIAGGRIPRRTMSRCFLMRIFRGLRIRGVAGRSASAPSVDGDIIDHIRAARSLRFEPFDQLFSRSDDPQVIPK